MKPIRLPWRGKDVPSAIIDVVRGCNCVCKACFNRRPPAVKPLEEIRTELSALVRSSAAVFAVCTLCAMAGAFAPERTRLIATAEQP